jgi:RNA polymerase sigma-70 factor (ECF subfamily)
MSTVDRALELQLLSRLRAGDVSAFDAVYDGFNTRLYRFLVRLTNRREVAEDLLEETWLRLVTHASRLRPDTHLGPWLFTVARNLHVSYCRSRLLEDSYATALLGLWPCGVPSPSPFAAMEATEARQRLATALASVPRLYREALLLVGVEGLRPREAAEVCGVTPEVMRQRLSRARASLAHHLSDEAPIVRGTLKEVTV